MNTLFAPLEPTTAARTVLPPLTRHPFLILLAVLLPQLVLLLINGHHLRLIWGELPQELRVSWTGLLTAQAVVLAGWTAYAALRRGRPVPVPAHAALLLTHVALLTGAVWALGTYLLPPAIERWIADREMLVFYQFVFLTPPIFLGLLALACFPSAVSRGRDVALSWATLLGIPFLWYLAGTVWQNLSLPNFILITLFAFSTALTIGAFLRLSTMAFLWTTAKGPTARAVLTFIVALAAPIGGLLLNRSISFPADFQSPVIYGLTILNGIALLLPALRQPQWNLALWLLRCALFPFTLYFFIVFLPFLPGAIPAMLYAGAGFLILAPTALFVIHAKTLMAGLQDLAVRKRASTGFAAALIIPGAMALQMGIDRVTLHQAVNHLLTPDYRQGDRFFGSRWAVGRALENMRDAKHGRYTAVRQRDL